MKGSGEVQRGNSTAKGWLTLCLLLWPALALANSGTPLLWAGMLWLVSGNLFIGIFEWSLACKILRRPLSQGMFIVANYLSAGAGVWAVAWLTARVDFTLAGFTGLALMWSGAFALTLLVEFAPLWFQLRREPVECKTLIMTLVKVNLASYAVIFPLSFLLGSTKMWREVSVVAPSAVSVP